MEPSLAGGRRGYQHKHSQSNNDDDENTGIYTTRRHNNCTSSTLPFPHFPPPPHYPPPPSSSPSSNDIEYQEQQQQQKKRNGRNSAVDSDSVGGGKMHRYPDDLDSIELCIEAEQQSLSTTKSYKGGNNMVLGGSIMDTGATEPQVGMI